MDSNKEMVEVEGKKMKGKVQGLDFQIHECSFTEEQESGSSYRYKPRNDLYSK